MFLLLTNLKDFPAEKFIQKSFAVYANESGRHFKENFHRVLFFAYF